jgi:hypothetical protein
VIATSTWATFEPGLPDALARDAPETSLRKGIGDRRND